MPQSLARFAAVSGSCSRSEPPLYGAFFVKGVPRGSYPFSCTSVSLFDLDSPFPRPDPRWSRGRRAQKRSRMARSATRKGSSLRASSTTAHLGVSGMTTFEGSCGLVHEAWCSCHILVCGGPKTQTMMQGYASAASSEAADPFFSSALKPWEVPGHRHLEPSSATPSQACAGQGGRNRQVLWTNSLLSVCGTQDYALGHHAIAHEVPQGDEQLACQGDDHLLARAASVLGASFKPLG